MSMHKDWKRAKKALGAAGVPIEDLKFGSDLGTVLDEFEKAAKAYDKADGKKEATARAKRKEAAMEAKRVASKYVKQLDSYGKNNPGVHVAALNAAMSVLTMEILAEIKRIAGI